jgi:ADP-ribose pyrophosphatase YjhB (NUDIX family)
MIEHTTLEHHIQKHIMSILMHQKFARFKDMRPPSIDTNLYNYHLKLLLKRDFVKKTTEGYTLGKHGILYVDRISTNTLDVRTQPKIITMLVVQNSEGDILLYRRERQPFTDQWTLPYGKIHIEDRTVKDAAIREAYEKLGLVDQDLEHAGEVYIRVVDEEGTIMTTLAHVFRFDSDDIKDNERLLWVRPHKMAQYDLAPAVEKIVARTFFHDPHFFEEYEERW